MVREGGKSWKGSRGRGERKREAKVGGGSWHGEMRKRRGSTSARWLVANLAAY